MIIFFASNYLCLMKYNLGNFVIIKSKNKYRFERVTYLYSEREKKRVTCFDVQIP